jgi:hypothetical protein
MGHFSLALADARRLEELGPRARRGWPSGSKNSKPPCDRDDQKRLEREQRLESFERALAEGRLHDARDVLNAAADVWSKDELSKLDARLRERRNQASKALRKARDAVGRGLQRDARTAFEEARKLCSDSVSFKDRLVGLSANWAHERFQQVRQALADGQPFDAAQALAEWIQSEPEAEDLAEAQDLLLSVGERLAKRIREEARAGRFADALALACRVPNAFGRIHALRQLRERLERVQSLREASEVDPRQRAEGLRRLRRESSWEKLDADLRQAEKDAQRVQQELAAARKHIEAGELEKGRETLSRVLDQWPACEEARALLGGLLEDERERRERLDSAREAMRAGRLREAERQLLRLVSGGYGAEDARALLRDIARLQRKLARELSAVRARLEANAPAEELLASLAKLRRLQSDSPELEELEQSVLRRKGQGERIAQIRDALRQRKAQALLDGLRTCFENEHFDADDPGDRRSFAALGAEIEEALRGELSRGDALFAWDVARGLDIFGQNLELDVSSLRDAARQRIDEARRHARAGEEALDARDATRAESCLEAARAACATEASVLRLAHRVRRMMGKEHDLRSALELMDSDREGARERLGELGPTPRPLMSLAFEARDKLHRSGDFERGCRLEVEEAGEFLLFTEDRLRIGNASGSSLPQIPVLARIRAQHATLSRSVSFHGGVKHELESAAAARSTVNGRELREENGHTTELQSGDEILLGDVLPITFRRPNPRSSSTVLRLGRGFECLGVSRILWLKQGGRDGRILIGRGKDVHVRVRAAEPELFVWAPGPGRLSVYFAGLGSVDGAQFTGEKELSPGVTVRCGEIAFRVLPL